MAIGETFGVATMGVHDFFKPKKEVSKLQIIQEVLDLAGVKNISAEATLAKLAPTLEEKLKLQKQQKKLEAQRNKDRRELFERQDEVDLRREDMISAIEERLTKRISEDKLFTVRWNMI